MPTLKEGHVIEYRTVLGDRVVSVVSGPYTSATELRNGPHCGRKYEEEPWECTSKEDS